MLRFLRVPMAVLALAFAALVVAPVAVQAQEATPAADAKPADAKAAAADDDTSLLDTIMSGGWVMIPITGMSILGLGLAFYNGYALREKTFVRSDVAQELVAPINALDFEEVRRICTEKPCIMTNILAAGLERVEGGRFDADAVEKAMEAASAEEMAGPYVFVNMLNVVSGISTMLGLFGTVVGMVEAFQTLDKKGMGNPQALAGSISVALVTTVGGLTVAIPSLAAYHIFKAKYSTMTNTISRNLGDLLHYMILAVHRASSESATQE